ncbi:hypothetical protein IscW_ISCW022992 [Ixodes scapularis]|uniref:Uncharacterized protein n=1 Tax=Ixodes scapularis TaxID=6945 RepID=B7QM65_IXOSC|nr:hypothetical protein IscW_ISCW022992 [Ixodes scapularis]|eukprot:XP_002416270.1 hypothetical protein IscW_ISCW022992 [Ixodes scapularis]
MKTPAATSAEKATAEGTDGLPDHGSSEASTSAVKQLKSESQDKDREQPGTTEAPGSCLRFPGVFRLAFRSPGVLDPIFPPNGG